MGNGNHNSPKVTQGKYNTFPACGAVELRPEFDFEGYGIDKPNITTGDILEDAKKHANDDRKGVFVVKPANKWIEQSKTAPIPNMLFGEFWHSEELCVLFADTNLGKSILAVQIGHSISKGEQIHGFKLEAEKQTVLYFDFELSAKQFEVRYSVKVEGKKEFQNHFVFDDNFKRVEIDPEADLPKDETFEAYLNRSLERAIAETGARVIIIDNLTYLKNDTEKAKDALPLMKHLKALKSKYGLSILALAHTPKRDLSKPITRNDLQGSKMLINFVDSCFAIGESHGDKSMRYIKQIKARNTEIIYDAENVMTCQVQKPYNFLEFEFVGFGSERKHLKQLSDTDRESRISEATELKAQGVSNREIGRRLNVSEGAVRKWLKKQNNE